MDALLISPPKEAVCERLLQTAVNVFAEHGYKHATIREICTQADVNVASVNYYFRSKEVLYTHTLNYAFGMVRQRYPQTQAMDETLAPEQRLRSFIANFIHRLMDTGDLGKYSKLITREMVEPTKALSDVINHAIQPECKVLQEIIEVILGKTTDTATLNRTLLSIVGQCLVYKHSRPIIEQMFPELIAGEAAINACAEHVWRFSLAALTHKTPD